MSNTEVPADWVPGKNPLPALHSATFHCVLIKERERERERSGLFPLLIRALIPPWGPHLYDLI